MFSLTNLKVSITSLEFSLFLESSPRLCPNCRHLIENDFLTEVRLSSLVLLLGVGSLVCYKWLTDTINNKKKKALPFGLSKDINLKNNKCNELNDSRLKRYKMLSSTPFVELCGNVDPTPSLSCSDGSDLLLNFTDFSDENDYSVGKTSVQKIGNSTVAKLDQLLQQIQDIKESVCDIDEQIFDVKFEPKMFSLGPDMSTSFNTDSDLSEKLNYLSTEPQTPTLEWDLTDLNAFNLNNVNNGHNFSLINENRLISSLNSSYLRNHSLIESSKKSYTEDSNQLESPEDLTSGQFSISSASESKENNLAIIHNMISEAKKLGILKDLIDILVQSSKRDSAYFED